jgi:multicomponent Na+:H+ antiporter subunit A
LLALLAGVALELLLAGVLSPRAKGWLALVSVLGSLAGVIAAWPGILAGHVVDVAFGRWDGPVQLAYHIDGLSLLFALMGAGIGTAVLLYSVSYMDREKGTTRFYSLMLIFIAGLIHLVYTADLFIFYLNWEVVGLCSFLLVGFWYDNPDAAYGARKVFTITHMAGYGLLAAVVLLYLRSGSTLWTDPKVQGALTGGIFLLMIVSAVAKSVQFPLHTWIPFAMAAPTPVSALLHAACYVKAGVYLIARLHSMGAWPASWSLAVAWIGAVTLMVGSLFALAQTDLKRLLAYSTISQIGYMVLGLGIGTPLAIAAGLLHCLNHGLFKGSLFLCAGSVQHACGTREMDRLGGLGRRMPRTMLVWLVSAGSVAGLPLLNGFVSKWLLFNAALEAHQPLLALVPWVGSVITVFYFLKATSGVFLGSDGEATGHAHEVPWQMVGGAGVLAAGCVVLGIAPQLAITYVLNPLLPALGAQPLTGVSWFGFTAGQGTWFATGGLALSVIALGFGAIVYWLPLGGRRTALAAAGGVPTVFTGGEPLGPRGHLGASDFSRIVGADLVPFYRAFDVDRYWLSLWRGLGAVASRIAALVSGLERLPALALAGFAIAIAGVAALGPAGPPPASEAPAAVPLVGLAGAVAVSLAGLLLAAAAVKTMRAYVLPLALAGGLACVGILAVGTVPRAALLEGGTVIALLAIWRTSKSAAARQGYLAAVLLSAVGMVGGALAAEQGDVKVALILLLPGIAIKLGLFPFWFWIPLVAENVPAAIGGLVIGVVDVAAFAEVLTLRTAEPALFANAMPWLVLAVISAVGGAVLALAQRDLKRLLAFSTITDMGLLAAAVVLGGEYGLAGATLGAATHALGKALLFASVAGPEAEGERMRNARGLAVRHPLAGAGFVVGALAVLGVPPTLGYAAHWRIFAAAGGNPLLLTALAGAAMLSVAMYGRAIALFWWGAPDTPPPVERAYNRTLLAAAVVLLALGLLAAGLWPQLLGGIA